LRNGNIDVLLELFPWVKEILGSKSDHAPNTDSGQRGNPLPSDETLQAMLDRLEHLIMKSQTGLPAAPVPKRITGADRTLSDSLPLDEDDLLASIDMKADKDAGKRASENLLKSLIALQQMPTSTPREKLGSRA
jgi:hypothetical protein